MSCVVDLCWSNFNPPFVEVLVRRCTAMSSLPTEIRDQKSVPPTAIGSRGMAALQSMGLFEQAGQALGEGAGIGRAVAV